MLPVLRSPLRVASRAVHFCKPLRSPGKWALLAPTAAFPASVTVIRNSNWGAARVSPLWSRGRPAHELTPGHRRLPWLATVTDCAATPVGLVRVRWSMARTPTTLDHRLPVVECVDTSCGRGCRGEAFPVLGAGPAPSFPPVRTPGPYLCHPWSVGREGELSSEWHRPPAGVGVIHWC